MEESKSTWWWWDLSLASGKVHILEWSRIVRPLAPYNSNTLEGLIALILKIVRPEEVSRVSLGYH